MNSQSRFKIFIALLAAITIGWCLPMVAQAAWKTLGPGIMYQDLSPIYIRDWSHIHVFKVDPSLSTFELVQQKQIEKTFPSIIQYANYKKTNLAFNGGFFDSQLLPLGLRISNYKILNRFKKISWWSVFYIENKHPHIVYGKEFNYHSGMEFALQSGPRLVIHGKIPHLKPGLAERTALCILPNHEIAVIITQYFPMTLTQLGKWLTDEPLQCIEAINLDGGSSTQLFAKFSGFYLHMTGLASVSDAITVMPRS